jgi:hypothetical protein
MKRKTGRYLTVSFAWTWAFWLFAYFFSKSAGYALKTDATLFYPAS